MAQNLQTPTGGFLSIFAKIEREKCKNTDSNSGLKRFIMASTSSMSIKASIQEAIRMARDASCTLFLETWRRAIRNGNAWSSYTETFGTVEEAEMIRDFLKREEIQSEISLVHGAWVLHIDMSLLDPSRLEDSSNGESSTDEESNSNSDSENEESNSDSDLDSENEEEDSEPENSSVLIPCSNVHRSILGWALGKLDLSYEILTRPVIPDSVRFRVTVHPLRQTLFFGPDYTEPYAADHAWTVNNYLQSAGFQIEWTYDNFDLPVLKICYP